MGRRLLLFVIMFSVASGLTFIGCSDDEGNPTEPVDNGQTITLSEIFPMTVANEWSFANLDPTKDESEAYSVSEFTTSVEVTGTIDHIGHNGFVFHIRADQDGEVLEGDVYYYVSGDSLFESDAEETEWSWEEDIQGFSNKQVGDTLFWEIETSTENDIELEETDLLTIASFTESVVTDAGTFENCLVLKEEKFDIFRTNGTFVEGEHSVEYTYFAKGTGFIKSVDRDWSLTNETTDGSLLQYEEEVLTSSSVN